MKKKLSPFVWLILIIVLIVGGVVSLVFIQGKKNPAAEIQLGTLPLKQKVIFHDNEVELGSLLTAEKNLLVFWATWCGPCVDEMKNFAPLKEIIKSKGINIVFVNYDGEQDRGSAGKFAAKYQIETSYDTAGDLLFNIGISTLPTSLIVDKSGKIAKVISGELNESDF